MKTRYKLTNPDMTTLNFCQWTLDEWKETTGTGELCTKGWLHCYTSPLLSVILNPIHAYINNPRLFLCEVDGNTKSDYGLKEGWSRMRLIRELELPKITIEQHVAFAILCAKCVCFDDKWNEWNEWADNWLSGKDRRKEIIPVHKGLQGLLYNQIYQTGASVSAHLASLSAYYLSKNYAADTAQNSFHRRTNVKPHDIATQAMKY